MIMDRSLGPIELPIKLSPSALNNYDACKRRFYYSRKILRVDDREEPIFFKRGSEAHAVMDGTKTLDEISKEARTMAKKLIYVRDGLGITVKHTEVTQKWMLSDSIRYERRIDVLGHDKDGFGVIVDWKTASQSWSTIGNIAPKAMTWQTPGYLVPPPQELLDEIGWTDPWPRRMIYIVGPLRGRGQSFPLDYDQSMMDDFWRLISDIEQSVEDEYFPKSPGYNCTFCPMGEICFDQEGWRDMYEPRTD